MFAGELSIRNRVKELLPYAVMEVIDTNLVSNEREKAHIASSNCAVSALQLALDCSHELPEQRIDMKQVVAQLKKIKLKFLNELNEERRIGNSANLKKRGKQKSKVYNPDPSKDIPKIVSKHADPNDFDGQKVSDKAEDSEVSANKVEAEITLKMAKDLGVQFADFDQSMLKQLEILETGAT
ncbi:hypothetical protein V6N12_023445 [Hibiscus sabdariffa]|uniref:Uncharacterized protein n=1 Tax=Hibiscus sabdariffa TaxID=183260 RepID=A0ABR2FYM2_9ROSI